MNGLISFCDILGYKSLLENNSAIESAEQVLQIITDTPRIVPLIVNQQWASEAGPAVSEVMTAFKHIVFSDTIVLSISYPKNPPDEEWRRAAIAYMTHCTGHLKARMFLSGLPMRCVIHEGEFLIRETCIAGKAIVEAHVLADSLDLSALVFSQTLGAAIVAMQSNQPPLFTEFETNFIPYLTPMTNGTECKLLQYNWVAGLMDPARRECLHDIESFVLKSFWSHKKDCPISVDKKVNATSKLLRRCLMRPL